jgi:Predicted transcriptional regulator
MSQLERITYIDRRIRESGGVRIREVVERFEISERHARRDIDYLSDRIGAPIAWNPETRRYEYAEPWNGLDFADEKALLFYIFARAAAGAIAYVPLAEERQLARLLDFVPPALRHVEASIRYELPGYEVADIEKLGLIVRALAESRCLDVAYRDADGRQSERRIEARRLVNYAGSWYCVGLDQRKAELRTFRLSRMARLAISKDKIGSPLDEAELERFLDSSFGMFKGAGDKEAVMRFYGRAASIVRDELWHPDQKRAEGRDGARGAYVELSVPVSQWDEILGRLLRFGSKGEAIGPEEFRELWKEEIRKMAAMIGD